jgi:hypothetical protein
LLAEQLLCALQSLVEIFAETTDDRLLEGLIYGNAQLLAALHSVTTYRPAVVVESVGAVAELLYTNWVKMARNWL